MSTDFGFEEAPVIAAGRVVRLHDGRVGVVEKVAPSPFYGEAFDRAYVVGVGGEYAAWLSPLDIAHVYGVVATTKAAATTA